MLERLIITVAALLLLLLWIICIWSHLPALTAKYGTASANVNPAANSNANVKLESPSLKIAFENGKYRITGTVPDETTKQKIIAKAKEVYGEGNFLDELKVGGVSAPSWLDSVLTLLPFTKSPVTGGGLSAEGNSLSLTGQVANQAEKDKIYKDALAVLPPNTTVNNLLTVAGQQTLTAEQAKTQIKLNEALAGKTIEFETNSDKLTDKGKQTLDELAPIIKNSTENLEIGGHTDADGNDSANLSLSQRRAVTVKNYLVSKGDKPERFETKGYGETKPIADNSKPEGKQKNRRIEFQVKVGGGK